MPILGIFLTLSEKRQLVRPKIADLALWVSLCASMLLRVSLCFFAVCRGASFAFSFAGQSLVLDPLDFLRLSVPSSPDQLPALAFDASLRSL